MNLLISVIPAVIFFSLYACAFKISAFLLGRANLSWKHSWIFVFFVVFVSVLVQATLGIAKIDLPFMVVLFPAVLLNFGLGAWFFGTRVTKRNGELFGYGMGTALSAMAFGLLFLVAILLNMIRAGLMSGL